MLEDVASNLNVDLRKDYSGRNMFGRECIGFTTNTSGLKFGLELACELAVFGKDGTNLLDEMKHCKEDNMGREFIYYFPDLQWGE